MKKTKGQTDSIKLRIIMSRHGEGIHNVAIGKIRQIWKDGVDKIREKNTKKFDDTSEINIILDISGKKYKNRKYDIACNLLETVDAKKYKDPSLTEKGMVQASYSGKALQAYVDENGLQLSSLVFSSPFARTINSLEEVLQNLEESKQERFAIPDLIETSGRYVDTYDERKNYGEYAVLGDGIDVQAVMKGGETDEQVVERSKRGLEKVYKKLKKNKEGLPIVMTHGGVMKAFSNAFFKGEVGKIDNSDLWDLEVSFDESGKFIDANLIEKIIMNGSLQKEFDAKLDGLESSEKLLDEQDFSPVENALSSLLKELATDVEKSISDNQKASMANIQELQGVGVPSMESGESISRDLNLLAQQPSTNVTTTVVKKFDSTNFEERKAKKQKL